MILTEQQLTTMLDLQAGMNAKVNPDWVAAHNNWYRAIQVEGVEAIEHHGWKWWKKQTCDMAQLQMELVDIWHFILSAYIQEKEGDLGQARIEMLAQLNLALTSVQFDQRYYVLSQMSLLEKLDLMVGLATAQRVSLALFESLLVDCKMSWNALYKQYLGKNVLNFFRQDHGYKAGTYIKVWQGREDNEHLTEILEVVDWGAEGIYDTLYQHLKSRYIAVTASS